METTYLSLRSLHLMSPGLASDFEEKITQAVLDCKQRPSLAKKREVCIKFQITPHPEDADDVAIDPVVTSTTPARKLETVRARRTRTNQLQFDFDEETM